jgi:hypothetical protein
VIACGIFGYGVISLSIVGVGVVALGTLAVGLVLAMGGVAVAPIAVGGAVLGYYANGALAWGAHAIGPSVYDPSAETFFNPRMGKLTGWIFRGCLICMPLFLALGFIPALMAKLAERRSQRRFRHITVSDRQGASASGPQRSADR